jgi:hypothetical protein
MIACRFCFFDDPAAHNIHSISCTHTPHPLLAGRWRRSPVRGAKSRTRSRSRSRRPPRTPASEFGRARCAHGIASHIHDLRCHLTSAILPTTQSARTAFEPPHLHTRWSRLRTGRFARLVWPLCRRSRPSPRAALRHAPPRRRRLRAAKKKSAATSALTRRWKTSRENNADGFDNPGHELDNAAEELPHAPGDSTRVLQVNHLFR